MKKVVIRGERRAEIVDAPDPRPKEDWALVKVHATPMCTEYKAWLAGRKSEYLGHEAVGEVVEVAQPCGVEVGDRVVVQPQYPCGRCRLCVEGEYIHCEHTVDFTEFTGSPEGRATYAQLLVKPSWLLSPIPDDVSYERAGLALCGLGPTFGAMEAMEVGAFDTVLITGAGPVGLGGVVNARFRGARAIVVEGHPWRVERAKTLGAAAVIDPGDDSALQQIRDLTGGLGVDKAVDCCGAVAAHRLCIDAARRKGQVAFVGEAGDDTPFQASRDLIRKGLVLRGSWHYNLANYDDIMKVIRGSAVIDDLISHVLPMREVQQAFALSASHDSAKIILRPWA